MQFLNNPSVGDMIRELYLAPTNLSVEGAATLCDIPLEQFQRILADEETIGYELAFKLGQGFNTSYSFFLNLAQDHAAAKTETNDVSS